MKTLALSLLAMTSLPALGQMAMGGVDHPAPHPESAAAERLGTVSFSVSCAAQVQAPFNRGVALLHDFWYEEAQRQFDQIVKADPGCAMARWGAAMSSFHQIWNRPDAEASAKAWRDLKKARSAKTERERAYIAALSDFFHPAKKPFPQRIRAYSDAMGRLYNQYPDDNDAGAFYALSLLAAAAPDDTTLTAEHKAMTVLAPLYAKYPDNPGVDHYIIHACDNPAMASQGLAAADHYGKIAPSGPHAFHMPGHIYARLGLWPQDIASQVGSIKASEAAEAKGESGVMDEPHSYDFLLYAYLQSGQDARAKATLEQSAAPLKALEAMPGMGIHHRLGMIPYYKTKLPVFYALEMRDWKSAAAMEPVAGSPAGVSTLVYWARAMAHGRLHEAEAAKADLAKYDALMDEIRKGKNSYEAEGNGAKIERNEIVGWVAFAESRKDDALKAMRDAADLQDKVGQGEVDIPAREMLADMLLELGQPRLALTEYEVALKLSPNRLNGLYNAGLAAEQSGEKAEAQQDYEALLKTTDGGAQSARPEFAHAKSFLSSAQLAVK